MAKNCCVCGDLKESPENRLFRCGGQGCGITVHQACYGIVTIPSGLWFCRKCESQERAARVKCELCPRKDGALKRTDSGTWAHVVCALYIPEVTFGNLRTMEPIITSKLPRERFTKQCYICEGQGQENQASTGACMSCHRSNCRLAFHVTCAQKEQLLVEEQDPRDSRNIIYCGYCGPHYKRMKKQKLKKQHNQSGTPHHSGGGGVGVVPSGIGSIGGSVGGSSIPIVSTSAGSLNHLDLPVGVASNSHPHPSADVAIQQSNNMYMGHAGGGAYHHGNKQLTKVKSEGDRLSKRSSSDVGILPSAKRKYRRRKLSSSNESTSSESLSLASEPAHHTIPSSPSITASRSPSVFHSEAKKIGNEDSVVPPGPESSHTTSEDMDCGNLDLLASVTQRIDKFDRVHNEILSSSNSNVANPTPTIDHTPSMDHATTPIVKMRSSPPVSMVDSKEGIKKNTATVSRSSSGCGKKRKVAANTTSSGSSQQQQRPPPNSSQLSPPTTLQELLERQWEQTAQFILDQAGKQNNAGVMLAHLHELQSENRSMQSRIMELASQREFFIATNSRLRQTLTGSGASGSGGGSSSTTAVVSKGINGMQIVPSTLSQATVPSAVHQPPPISNHTHHNYYRSIDSGNSSFLTRSPGNHPQHVAMVTESQQTGNNTPSSSSSGVSTSIVQLSEPSEPLTGHTHKTTISSGGSPTHNSSHRYTSEATPTTNQHEVTHVTNSVQGPIATFTGFPDNHAPYSSHQLFSQYSHRHST